MSTTRKTLLLNILLGAVTLLCLWGIGKNFTDKMGFSKKPAPRGEMRVLLGALKLEDSAAQVARKFGVPQFKELKLDTRNSQRWNVRTPLEFGSKNWQLYLEFDGNTKRNPNAKLTAIRLRTPDGLDIPPRDINFPDLVRDGWVSPIAQRWNRP